MLKWLWVSVLVVILDQVTKQLAESRLAWGEPVEIYSWFNLILAYNRGAAFSFLSDAGGWQRWFFTILASIVSLILIVWVLRLPRREWLTGLALALVIGGAIGNLVDRVQLGYVVDFIDVFYQGWHWPAFNVADSAITCGVILMLLDALRQTLRSRKSEG